jgi:hypothetical protein
LLFGCLSGPAAAQTLFGRNLIVNGNAEDGKAADDAGSIAGWKKGAGTPRTRPYPATDAQGQGVPANHGANYFNGGPDNNSSLTQLIDLAPAAQEIDGGAVTYDASAFLGGEGSDPDAAQLTIVFTGDDGAELGTVTVGPVTPDDRDKRTSVVLRRQLGQVPAKTRKAAVTLLMTKVSGSNNSGSADDASFILVAPPAPESLTGRNLVVNGDAETGGAFKQPHASDVPGWCNDSYFAVDAYGGSGQKATTPGPKDRGSNFFYGGEHAAASAWQDIYMEPATKLIDDQYELDYDFSGWLGGIERQKDAATVTAEFRDWSGKVLASATLGPVTADQRHQSTMLIQQSKSGGVPAGAKYVRLTMSMTRDDGSTDDGAVDNLSLVLTRRLRPPKK